MAHFRTHPRPARLLAISYAACLALGLVTLVGCASLSKPYPQKTLYGLNVPSPSSQAEPPRDLVVQVAEVRVAPPFDSRMFVYREGENEFASDYYDGFIASPGKLLTAELTKWLAASGAIGGVVSAHSTADYDLVLETNVTSMYGDFSDPEAPAAVLEARFFMVDHRGGRFAVLFESTSAEREPLASSNPAELVRAWNRAGERLFASLAADLAKASFDGPEQPASAAPSE